ncbi:MAG: ABC transporter ATP-binding protein [Acidobacteria bacterium]|nr:ABC transporter ATP-binding protein [Acidobacteriota bacterium]
MTSNTGDRIGLTGPVLTCTAIRKTFGSLVAVNDVSFHIDPGETYGLLGPNGAGKTTVLSLVVGVLEADGGEVVVAGEIMNPKATRAKTAVGYVPQDVAIYPDLSARENLMFFGRLVGLSGRTLKNRAAQVLEIVALSDRAKERTSRFSGGMRRRLNIGIGLMHKPRLLVLDEPTVGVDPQSRNAILESVDAMATEGMAILYTTHYMEEAERLCDRIGIIDNGKIVAEGTRRELVQEQGGLDSVHIGITGHGLPAANAAMELESVYQASVGDKSIELIVTDARASLAGIIKVVVETGANITGVEIDEPNLESVFLHLTGKALRD